jgi:hypothetical protein
LEPPSQGLFCCVSVAKPTDLSRTAFDRPVPQGPLSSRQILARAGWSEVWAPRVLARIVSSQRNRCRVAPSSMCSKAMRWPAFRF